MRFARRPKAFNTAKELKERVQCRPPRDSHGRLILPDLSGKTVLVTGASSGIGRAAALRLAAAGATVLAHGRSAEKLAGMVPFLGTEPLLADFARLADVRLLAERVLERTERLDAIMHNAGSFHRRRILTEDGHESTFQINYLAAFLLQLLLQERLVSTPGSRVVVTTSVAGHIGRVDLDDLGHTQGRHRPFRAYADTKLMNVLFVKELRRRLERTGVASVPAAGASTPRTPSTPPSVPRTPAASLRSPAPPSGPSAVAVHPGAVATNFGSGSLLPRFVYRIPIRKELLIGYFVKTAEEGAEPLVWQVVRRNEGCADALYFHRFAPGRSPRRADDPELASALWERSEQMVRPWYETGCRPLRQNL